MIAVVVVEMGEGGKKMLNIYIKVVTQKKISFIKILQHQKIKKGGEEEEKMQQVGGWMSARI